MSEEDAVRDALVAELAVLRARLRGEPTVAAEEDSARARGALAGASPFDRLAHGFGLSDFERAVLLLTAGPELVAKVADELTAAGGGSRLTFGTALALLPDAHWSALTPGAPLRRWQLVHLLDPLSPATSPLVVDERALHHLVGVGSLDSRLSALSTPLAGEPWLPPPLRTIASALLTMWRRGHAAVLHGPQPGNARAVAAAAAARAGLAPLELAGADLPSRPEELAVVLRAMERETVLGSVAWVVDVSDVPPADLPRVLRHLQGVDAPLAVVGGSSSAGSGSTIEVLAVPRLTGEHRAEALATAMQRTDPSADAEAEVRAAAAAFDLPLDAIARVAEDVATGTLLWQACRRRSRLVPSPLAAVVEPRAHWSDLVLPQAQLQQLRALTARVRHRALVLEDWGFAARSARGLGAVALFAGPSGTGKTLAAEVIANDLDLDLVRVDLSQVMSKYIGETEKHLATLFDTAEDGGAILLFDEADTLFGKRSEVRDSHDRYANIEVGYLLQRVESFRGLAILTTNSRSTLDPAFTRRIGTIVTFPYPDAALRADLWHSAFPAATPVDGLDTARLAAIDLPGGGIAAAALAAAYLAADDVGPVSPRHIETATRWELAKSGRSMQGAPR